MARFDKQAATAQRLVNKNGRAVTLVEMDFDAPDATKPWRGPTCPRDTPVSTAEYIASFVKLSGADLGFLNVSQDMAKRGDTTAFIGTSDDLTCYQELVDSKDGKRYKIQLLQKLDPADPTILWFLVLKQ